MIRTIIGTLSAIWTLALFGVLGVCLYRIVQKAKTINVVRCTCKTCGFEFQERTTNLGRLGKTKQISAQLPFPFGGITETSVSEMSRKAFCPACNQQRLCDINVEDMNRFTGYVSTQVKRVLIPIVIIQWVMVLLLAGIAVALERVVSFVGM